MSTYVDVILFVILLLGNLELRIKMYSLVHGENQLQYRNSV